MKGRNRDCVNNEDGIAIELHNYFKEIFKTESPDMSKAILECVPNQITVEMNN